MTQETPHMLRRSRASGRMVRNVLHLGVAQVASTVLGFALTAALGRYLGPADFGLYVTISMIWVFVYVVVDWGQAIILIREVARGRADEPVFLGSSLVLRLLGTLCAFLMAAALSQIFGFDKRVALLAPLTVLIQVPWVIAQAYCYLFRARDRMDADAVVSVVGKGLTLAATLVVLRWGGGLAEVVWAQIVGAVAALAVGLGFARQMGIRTAMPAMTVCGEFFTQGVPLVVLSITVCLQPIIELLLLSHLTTPEVVGWYGAARNITGIFLSPAMILVAASFPAMSRAAADLSEFRRILEQSGKVLVIAAALASASLFVFSDFGVAVVYGKGQFDQTSQVLRVFAVFLPIWFAGFLFGAGVNAFGRAGRLAVAKVVSIVVSAPVGWVLVTHFQSASGNGAIAVMITSGLAEVGMLAASCMLMPSGSVSRRVR